MKQITAYLSAITAVSLAGWVPLVLIGMSVYLFYYSQYGEVGVLEYLRAFQHSVADLSLLLVGAVLLLLFVLSPVWALWRTFVFPSSNQGSFGKDVLDGLLIGLLLAMVAIGIRAVGWWSDLSGTGMASEIAAFTICGSLAGLIWGTVFRLVSRHHNSMGMAS